MQQKQDHNADTLATKADISDLKIEMRENKVDTIKWIISLWVAQAALFIGLYLNQK